MQIITGDICGGRTRRNPATQRFGSAGADETNAAGWDSRRGCDGQTNHRQHWQQSAVKQEEGNIAGCYEHKNNTTCDEESGL